MPEPTTAKLVDKKTAAYEKQQAEVEEESRMKSLEQLVGTLMNNGNHPIPVKRKGRRPVATVC